MTQPDSPGSPADRGPTEPAQPAEPLEPGRRHAPSRAELEARARATRVEFEAGVQAARAQFDATNEKIRARTGRNLIAAIAVGVSLGAALLASLLIIKWLFIVFGAALIGFTVFELAGALRIAGRNVPRVASTVVGLAVVPIAFFFHVEGLWLATLGAVIVLTIYRLLAQLRPLSRRSSRELARDLGAATFVQIYVTFMAGFYLALTGSENGQFWTLASLIIVVATDVGAYAAGLAWGRHKLAPKISPGKTWEGFAGSLVVAIVAGVLLAVFMLGISPWIGAVMGLLLGLVGTAGDLTESLIKRDLGVKDISTWLPGHGGFLDRLDSILPSAAVAYAIYLLVT
ncbi:MAG TPA: phosphatidate cytidylyltransferase [Pseudolysinimonas sp.]|nr:phosphatidate cytidylyltransferase [Pseudolysinimonas sp.]